MGMSQKYSAAQRRLSINSSALAVYCLIFFLSPVLVTAQNNWSIETHTSVNYPVKKFGSIPLAVGLGLEGTVHYRFKPQLSAYAGWGWNQFNQRDGHDGPAIQYEEEGYLLGVIYSYPLRARGLQANASAGAVYNHIGAEDDKGEMLENSGHGLGWQLSCGLSQQLGCRWKITADVRYKSLSRSLKIDDKMTEVSLRYLSTGIGIAWSF
jgi:hypothetical protein